MSAGSSSREHANPGRRLFSDESGGGNAILMVVLCIGLLALVPFFIDIASTYYARRMAQSGSDAGALSGAKEVALLLSRQTASVSDLGWHRSEDAAWNAAFDVAASTYFQEVYADSLSAGLVQVKGAVISLAEANGTEVDESGSFVILGDHYTDIRGNRCFDVLVGCDVDRDVRTWMGNLYGRDFEAPAKATAETYLLKHEFARDKMLEKPVCDYMDNEGHCEHWHMEYQGWSHLVTEWKIHLYR